MGTNKANMSQVMGITGIEDRTGSHFGGTVICLCTTEFICARSSRRNEITHQYKHAMYVLFLTYGTKIYTKSERYHVNA